MLKEAENLGDEVIGMTEAIETQEAAGILPVAITKESAFTICIVEAILTLPPKALVISEVLALFASYISPGITPVATATLLFKPA